MCRDKERYYKVERFEAICGWGFAEDIIVVDEFEQITVGMTTAQAKKLIADLQHAVAIAEDLQTSIETMEILDNMEKEIGKD